MTRRRLASAAAACAAIALTVAAMAREAPRDHVRIEGPDLVSARDAEMLYRSLAGSMQEVYAASGDEAARNYLTWRRYNSAPYLSDTHGNRYVNNYGNAAAADYATVAMSGGTMTAGAVIAKDSFTVTAEGEVLPAALFIMEKLPAGSSPESGDWRYAMILPDGTFFGDTSGNGSGDVAYCHACHQDRRQSDYLFFLPPEYRLPGDSGGH